MVSDSSCMARVRHRQFPVVARSQYPRDYPIRSRSGPANTANSNEVIPTFDLDFESLLSSTQGQSEPSEPEPEQDPVELALLDRTFDEDCVSQEVKSLLACRIPAATLTANRYALGVLNRWLEPSAHPYTSLDTVPTSRLNYVLSEFIARCGGGELFTNIPFAF